VTVTTTGPDAPATYTVYVDNGPSTYYAQNVPSNGTVSFALALGTYSVGIGARGNCTVASPTSVSVTVAAGAPTKIAFSVTCVALGAIQVTTVTTGTNAPGSYPVRISGNNYNLNQFLLSNGTVSFHLPAGSYSVRLTVPPTCAVNIPHPPPFPSNPQHVTVAPGATASVGFTLTCR
jgi:hypothetical protein